MDRLRLTFTIFFQAFSPVVRNSRHRPPYRSVGRRDLRHRPGNRSVGADAFWGPAFSLSGPRLFSSRLGILLRPIEKRRIRRTSPTVAVSRRAASAKRRSAARAFSLICWLRKIQTRSVARVTDLRRAVLGEENHGKIQGHQGIVVGDLPLRHHARGPVAASPPPRRSAPTPAAASPSSHKTRVKSRLSVEPLRDRTSLAEMLLGLRGSILQGKVQEKLEADSQGKPGLPFRVDEESRLFQGCGRPLKVVHVFQDACLGIEEACGDPRTVDSQSLLDELQRLSKTPVGEHQVRLDLEHQRFVEEPGIGGAPASQSFLPRTRAARASGRFPAARRALARWMPAYPSRRRRQASEPGQSSAMRRASRASRTASCGSSPAASMLSAATRSHKAQVRYFLESSTSSRRRRHREPLQSFPEDLGALAGLETLAFEGQESQQAAGEVHGQAAGLLDDRLHAAALGGEVGRGARRTGGGAVVLQAGEGRLDALRRHSREPEKVLQPLAVEGLAEVLVVVDEAGRNMGQLAQFRLAYAQALTNERERHAKLSRNVRCHLAASRSGPLSSCRYAPFCDKALAERARRKTILTGADGISRRARKVFTFPLLPNETR